MKILLCVDSSQHSQNALKAIASQYRPQESDVRILHVLQPMAISAAPQMDPMYTPELRQEGVEAKKLVDCLAAELRSTGFRAETLLAKGDVRETIVDVAEKWHAELIVVGSRGKGGLRRLLLGSVAEFVARHASCSVLIARSAATE